MKIEFYTPKNESIPTNLRLKVDDKIDVYYNRLSNGPVYRFMFLRHQGVNCFLADKIINQIVWQMKAQSYDHGVGSYWEEISRGFDTTDEHQIIVTVSFTMRDAEWMK